MDKFRKTSLDPPTTIGDNLTVVKRLNSDDRESLGPCEACGDPLCGGSCQGGPGRSIAKAGAIGFVAITLILIARIAIW